MIDKIINIHSVVPDKFSADIFLYYFTSLLDQTESLLQITVGLSRR